MTSAADAIGLAEVVLPSLDGPTTCVSCRTAEMNNSVERKKPFGSARFMGCPTHGMPKEDGCPYCYVIANNLPFLPSMKGHCPYHGVPSAVRSR